MGISKKLLLKYHYANEMGLRRGEGSGEGEGSAGIFCGLCWNRDSKSQLFELMSRISVTQRYAMQAFVYGSGEGNGERGRNRSL